MDDMSSRRVEFLKEISALHQRIEELEASEARHAREKKELSLILRKLRFLVDACPDLFFLKDMDLRYQLVNSADAEFIGRDAADILGRTDIELMAPETAAVCQESDGRAIHERRTVVSVEPVGERFYETRRFPVVLEGGNRRGGWRYPGRDETETRRGGTSGKRRMVPNSL